MTYTRTRTFLEPGRLYRVTRSTHGFVAREGRDPTDEHALAKPFQLGLGTFILAVGAENQPSWVRPLQYGCWVLVGETKVWLYDNKFLDLEVVDTQEVV